eukprot:1177759-Rhodomonas_salina.1
MQNGLRLKLPLPLAGSVSLVLDWNQGREGHPAVRLAYRMTHEGGSGGGRAKDQAQALKLHFCKLGELGVSPQVDNRGLALESFVPG